MMIIIIVIIIIITELKCDTYWHCHSNSRLMIYGQLTHNTTPLVYTSMYVCGVYIYLRLYNVVCVAESALVPMLNYANSKYDD